MEAGLRGVGVLAGAGGVGKVIKRGRVDEYAQRE